MLTIFRGEIDQRLAVIMSRSRTVSSGSLHAPRIRSAASAKRFGAQWLGEQCGQLQAPPARLADACAIAAEVEGECRAFRRALSETPTA